MFRLCSLLVLLAAPLGAGEASGPIRVVDADTFDIGLAENVRLIGIDAAEGAQTCTDASGTILACGEMASAAARRLYQGKRATCRWEETDRYGRPLAVCTVEGRDANADLVRLGLARTYRDSPAYAEEEKEAQLLARGLWAYEMMDPAAWRAAQRASGSVARTDCAIKGNMSSSGRIYHMPGQRDYDATRIDTRRGERWFCSEREAREAGWRKARR
ncbi:thermonuclease family protein [Jannaschia aquimarina]|uniref:NucH protein n=1 Tax=Jannaschia aquimarina TaxID=935700 RepID=A0A0D1EED4_9RHOB|nr:thermonuclease family protein [Jannaschia aquimarina]KIT16074.1 Thermonuclease precursor [Jannaschia aquimarina]SNT01709.1 Endonuclease YncB, thermonuclease family [Jannaschia aquimarina]